MENNQIIVFVKNKELGKVKTRLAKTIGNEKALLVYKILVQHTQQIVRKVKAIRKVYYSKFIDANDEFENVYFEKQIQHQSDNLGERMYEAFNDAFKEQSTKVIVIGSDCYELNERIIEEAFAQLDQHDFVVGPAKDGGYYLIGMKKLNKAVFENIVWSTENVFLDTLLSIKNQGKTYALVATLSDVDEEKDLGDLVNFI